MGLPERFVLMKGTSASLCTALVFPAGAGHHHPWRSNPEQTNFVTAYSGVGSCYRSEINNLPFQINRPEKDLDHRHDAPFVSGPPSVLQSTGEESG